MLSHCAGDGGKQSPVSGASTKETVKTIARGMPGDLGATVVTNSRVFYLPREAAGALKHPAFPAPSDIRGQNVRDKLTRVRGEISMLCLITMASAVTALERFTF
jgi:hypothetical protein